MEIGRRVLGSIEFLVVAVASLILGIIGAEALILVLHAYLLDISPSGKDFSLIIGWGSLIFALLFQRFGYLILYARNRNLLSKSFILLLSALACGAMSFGGWLTILAAGVATDGL